MASTNWTSSALSLSKPILGIGFGLGLLLSVGVLSGDEQGRVNLLYLLFVFWFVPFIGAVISLISLFSGRGVNLARLLTSIPLWPKATNVRLQKWRQHRLDKHWFFMQSQAAALAYALATLLAFAALLVTTDINFVWRSTVLEAEQLHGFLSILALPWSFWDAAQPSLDWVIATQDSRLQQHYDSPSTFSVWWPFVVAMQIVYCLLLRLFFFAGANMALRKQTRKLEQAQHHLNALAKVKKDTPHTETDLQPAKLPEHYSMCNWAQFDTGLLHSLSLSPSAIYPISAESEEQILAKISDAGTTPLVIVKSWEPPLGELSDFMVKTQGFLFPIDLQGNKLTQPNPAHIQEWQRFVNEHTGWTLYQPAIWVNQA